MTFILILSLFVFILLTPKTCFGMGRKDVEVGAGQVAVWAFCGTLFFTLKFLV